MPLIRFASLVFLAVMALATSVVAEPELSRLTFETTDGPRVFQVEVADTPEKQTVGLMYRRSMAEDRGMLFDFGKPREVMMWMQNTYISLDMVFVGADGRVLRIAEKTEPQSTRIIPSEGPARYVVELVAGAARRIGLRPGDQVIHPRVGA